MKRIISLLLTLSMLFTLAVAVCADENYVYTPSVTQKQTPEIVGILGPDGKEYAAVAHDADGNVYYIPFGDIVLTPYVEREKLLLEENEKLAQAYLVIDEATDLVDVFGEEIIDVEKDNIVSYLFDTKVIGDSKAMVEAIFAGGGYVELKWKFKTTEGAELKVATQGGTDWVKQEVTDNRKTDETFTVRFSEFCPTAIIESMEKLEMEISAQIQENFVETWKRFVKWLRDNWIRTK